MARDVLEGEGRWLVAEDATGRVARRLKAERWTRWARGDEPASLEPTTRDADHAGLRLPRDKAALDYALHQVAGALKPGGTLWLYGHNDEGAKSAGKRLGACHTFAALRSAPRPKAGSALEILDDAPASPPISRLLPASGHGTLLDHSMGDRLLEPLFEAVETVATKRHCRVWTARRTDAPARTGIDSWLTTAPLAVAGGTRPWQGLPGLFAKSGLDAATELLVGALDAPRGRKVLDFGCGTGVITQALVHSGLQVTASDADALAVEITRRNVPEAEVVLSDCWHGLRGRRFDRVVSNPPIHSGKMEDYTVLRALMAPEYLAPRGDLWLVIQRQVPVERLLAERFKQVELKAQTTRFRVWRATEAR
jgi:16S rRNA (guanine1207-N2)-methyltransferase